MFPKGALDIMAIQTVAPIEEITDFPEQNTFNTDDMTAVDEEE